MSNLVDYSLLDLTLINNEKAFSTLLLLSERAKASVQVINIVAATISKKDSTDISATASWYELGVDSLDILDIVLQCEREFNTVIPDEKVMSFYSINDIVDFLVLTPDIQEHW